MSVVVCNECGHRNPAGTRFCGKCESYLDWNDSLAETPSVGAAPETPSAGATPAVVRPDQTGVRHTPVTQVEESPSLGEGEIACRKCGTANAADRRFCRACKAPLTQAAAPPPKLPWWRRVLRFLFLKRAYRAGERRRVVGSVRLWPMVALLLVVLIVAVAPLRGLADRAVTAIRDRISTHEAVTPVSSRASSAVSGHKQSLVYDGVSNSYWAPASAPEGAWIELDFGIIVRVLDLVITSGVSKEKREFLTQGRPREIDVGVFTNGRGMETKTITLRDEPGGQRFTIGISDAIMLRLTIKSTYGMSPGRFCALAEVEIFGRG